MQASPPVDHRSDGDAPDPPPGSRAGRCWLVLILAAALPAVGCAHAGGPPPASAVFDRGMAAARSGDRAAAVRSLGATARACGAKPLGQQAALALAALELDPRHEDASPERAGRLALHLLRRPDRAEWTGRMATTLYLTAVRLRAGEGPLEPAPVEDLYPDAGETPATWGSCGPRFAGASDDSAARPGLPEPSIAERAARLRARVRALEDEVERLRSLLETDEPPP